VKFEDLYPKGGWTVLGLTLQITALIVVIAAVAYVGLSS
jgi:hypothetical protein